MAIAHVQDLAVVTATPVTTLQSGAFASSPISGNTIIVPIWIYSSGGAGHGVTSVTDTAGNTYVKDAARTASVPQDAATICEVWRSSNITGGSSFKITVNTSGLAYITFTAAEFSGLTNASPLDGAGGSDENLQNVSQPDTGVFSTTNADDLLIGSYCIGNTGAATEPSGFTLIGKRTANGTTEDGLASYKIVSTTQTNINPTCSNVTSNAGTWVGIGLAYKAVVTGIAFDAASNSGYQAAQSTYSWSHTCTGSDRFLAVDVALLSAGQTVTNITYNGVSLDLIRARPTVTAFGRVECWGLVNPASGANTIAVTLSGSVASSAEAVSYTGVHQTSPTEGDNDNQATNGVSAADATVVITSVADQCWIHAALAASDSSVTALQTNRNNVTGVGGSGADEDFGPQSPGAKTMSYTDVGALMTWAIAGYAIRPVAAASLVNPWGWGDFDDFVQCKSRCESQFLVPR